MKLVTNIKNIKNNIGPQATAVALGTFDGVHIGHQSIIRQAVQLARQMNGISVVFTFSNHPFAVLAPDRAPKMIGDNISKAAIMAALGVDVLINIPFTKEMSNLSPEEFLELLRDKLKPSYVITGPNFSFGAKGKGNPRMLCRVGRDYSFQAEIAPAVELGGQLVSSTRIRQFIIAGELTKANEYLGHCFCFGGQVVHGDHRGRTLGFPTANLLIPDNRAMLPNGAYAVEVYLPGAGDGSRQQRYLGIANIGNNPTFTGCYHRMEINILDFSQDIYGQTIEICFVSKLREEQKFSGIEALKAQLHKDEAQARKILA